MLESLTIVDLFAALVLCFRFNGSFLTRRIFYFLNFILLTLHDGLRWNMGTDWEAYHTLFNSFSLENYLRDVPIHLMSSDHGFYFFVQLIHNFISSNYTVYLIIFSFISYGLLIFSTASLTNYNLLSLSVFPGWIAFYSGSQRQFIALSVFYFILYLLSKNETITLYIFSLIGLSLHISLAFPLLTISLLNLRYYFVLFQLKKLFNTLHRYRLFIFSLLLVPSSLIYYQLSINPRDILVFLLTYIPLKPVEYVDFNLLLPESTLGSPVLAITKKLLIIVFFIYYISKIRNLVPNSPLIRFLILSPFISLTLHILSFILPQFSINSRLDLYFGTASIVLLSGIIFNNVRTLSRIIIFFFICTNIYFTYSRFLCLELFHPYYFFFSDNIPAWNGCGWGIA